MKILSLIFVSVLIVGLAVFSLAHEQQSQTVRLHLSHDFEQGGRGFITSLRAGQSYGTQGERRAGGKVLYYEEDKCALLDYDGNTALVKVTYQRFDAGRKLVYSFERPLIVTSGSPALVEDALLGKLTVALRN